MFIIINSSNSSNSNSNSNGNSSNVIIIIIIIIIIIASIIVIIWFIWGIDYTRSPLEDSGLFGPSPWKILATAYEKKVPEQPSPWRKSCKRESCYGDRV